MAEENISFEELKLSRQFLNAIDDLGYTAPTPIQKKAIPIALAGHDLLGIAQTGTGKTAAFVLPILMKLKYAQGDHVRALILAPTRELVMQIEGNARELARYTDLRIVSLYGGLGPKQQIEAVEKGVDIIVSTPQRFLDIYLKGIIHTKLIKTMVLDEADKMMDMGFMPQIKNVLEVVPRKRQNMLFSATMHDKVILLTEDFLEFPEKIEIAPQATVIDTIEQRLYEVPNFKTKINLLEHFLKSEELQRVIVFTKTRTNADNVSKFIERRQLGPVRVIHANKGQNSRINAMSEFKEGDVRVLVSTDVTARGMDISMVSHVINFDVPLIDEDYVHRIGRTGRANNAGIAITFANELEMFSVAKIEALIQNTITRHNMPSEVLVEKTPFVEGQEMLRAIDDLKKKDDPEFKGAFHEKKKKFSTKSSKSSSSRTKGKGQRKGKRK
ncbi:DEAD/DEAH box helicase [Roseivirga echinicomitans]|uniref:DEAD/DEAH box helicase n=1 Tax=Roseivirga echinicomitans TaxID=296218 RepID=A0A150XD63_9BACT|nr:DEAD/DEAH box helicase [Roseivirga echinicomitans]KYG76665.1 DEAD/DEAH box helicase [Roseivirga echinicomitans]